MEALGIVDHIGILGADQNRVMPLMQEVANFHGISLIDQWSNPSKELGEKVIALWERNGILPPGADARDRVKQVVLVALNAEGEAIGVNTAYTGELPRLKPDDAPVSCYFYRMFIQAESRTPHLMRIMTTSAYDVLDAQRPDDGPDVFAIITDNLGLTRPGMLKLFQRYGYIPKMRLPGGKLLIVKAF
ncbi:hypothetical protein HKCCSP123_05390 [Rhodobacterales bacterium HKCCSP123]|nr:hypothetical protein [Rhodobacterales bacterium HKCCSP123]